MPSAPESSLATDLDRKSRDRREKRVSLSPRFRDGRFRNTHHVNVMKAGPDAGVVWDFVRGDPGRTPSMPLPLYAHTRAELASPPSSSLRVTWLGHSTLLLEIDGVRLLTDPVWGKRASPVPFAGPKRFHPPPLALHELPPIDAVLLTHDHYDHLCKDTVTALARGAAPNFSGRFITTLGTGAHLERFGVLPANITELDWGEGEKVRGENGVVDVIAVPAQHFSGRGALDRNKNLWAGFVVQGNKHRLFTSGDTGPTPEHKDIGQSFGPFDVVFFEIGAWHPSWGDIHLGPAAAYQAFLDCNARAFLPVHWGTFDLGLHPWEEPAETLLQLAQQDGAALWTPRLGQPLSSSARLDPWWREALTPARSR